MILAYLFFSPAVILNIFTKLCLRDVFTWKGLEKANWEINLIFTDVVYFH